MDAATIIGNVIAQSGMDASRATVLSLLNECYGVQIVRARYLMENITVGTTVSGTSDYALPASVVDIKSLKVGSYRFGKITTEQYWDLQVDGGNWTGQYGYYLLTYDSAGATNVSLFPTPTTAGLTITALVASSGTDLTDSGSSVPVTPSDLHGSLIDGTTALVLLRVDERPDLAQSFQARFDQATEELRRRKNARSGGGMQALVQGIHWS